MRKLLLLIVFLQYLVGTQAQSIIVNGAGDAESNYTAEQLVSDVFLDTGSCATSSNFQLKDNPSKQFPDADRSWGYFKKGTSDFPFESGIVLTTGYAKEAEGPNSGIVSKGGADWTGDNDAIVLAGTSTHNVTIFEFDFVPQGNEISFNYIFASEEFPVFACSTYNDVFGLILSGPGITNDPGLSGKNIALLPNGLPVTINNVNDRFCGDDTYYVGGPFNSIEYGGMTAPMTAYSQVTPGQTYHIKIVVADAVDRNYDSAVFLEANSFSLGAILVDADGVDVGDELRVCEESFTLFANATESGTTFQWYKDGAAIAGATTNSLTITESGLYKVAVNGSNCQAEDSVNVTFGGMETNGETFVLEKTDFDGDGFENFNLTLIQAQVVDVPANYTFKYYPTLADAENQTAQINNPNNYSAENNTVVYARVTDEMGCFAIVKIVLKVLKNCINPEAACPGPEFGLNIPFLGDGEIPSSAPPGPNYGCLYNQPYPRFYYFKIAESGDLYFNLNQYTQPNQQGNPIDVDFIVWGPFNEVPCEFNTLQNYVSCSYSASAFEYVSIPNAQAGEFYIMMITNYAGSYGSYGYVNLIFDEANSTGSFDCSIITGERTYLECDDDNNGEVEFDLAQIAIDITDGDPAQTVKFYSTMEDAEEDTNQNIIPTGTFILNEANSPLMIYGQIKDETGEVTKVIKVTLGFNPPVEGAENNTLDTCDTGELGFEEVNLTLVQLIDSQVDYELFYYENEADALAGNENFIGTPTAYNAEDGQVIYVRIVNEAGCFDVVTITISLEGLLVDLGEDQTICESEIILTAIGDFDPNSGIQFIWTLDGQVIPGENGHTLVVTAPGVYGVEVITDEGCGGSTEVLIEAGEIEVDLGEDLTICGSEIELFANIDVELTEAVEFAWTKDGQAIDGEYGQSLIVTEPGVYAVTVSTEFGCSGSDEIEITLGHLSVDLGEDFALCEGSVELTAQGNFDFPVDFVWTKDGEQIAGENGQTIVITSPGTYGVTASTEFGCTGFDTVVVGLSDIIVDLGPDFSMCEGEFELNATGDFSQYDSAVFTWTYNGETLDFNGPSIVVSGLGSYTLTVETEHGCVGSDTIVVSMGEGPTITGVTHGPDYVIIEATGGATPYQYSLNGIVWQDSNRFNYLQPGIYTFYVRSAEGCISVEQFAVLNIPTMFTPNGDGINDTWNIPGLEIYPGSNVVIYDRNGRLVYQAELTSNTIWNGYFMNGQKAPTTDYWYIINVTDGRKLTGHVTVKSRGEKN